MSIINTNDLAFEMYKQSWVDVCKCIGMDDVELCGDILYMNAWQKFNDVGYDLKKMYQEAKSRKDNESNADCIFM